ncbi:MAG: hypothetical protein IPG02_16975 [Ignavibacteria bacterium]|nr:hypothetical protein [Ignavibacteria bacterium]
MKTIILMLLTFLLLVFTQISPAQNPTYLLDVNDRTSLNNEFEFDIEMTWTNPGVARILNMLELIITLISTSKFQTVAI